MYSCLHDFSLCLFFVKMFIDIKKIVNWLRLIHWGRVMHLCVSKLTIGSDNGLAPCRRQTIILTNAGILLIWTWGTNFSEIFNEISTFLDKKMHLNKYISSGTWRSFCLSLSVLTVVNSGTNDCVAFYTSLIHSIIITISHTLHYNGKFEIKK